MKKKERVNANLSFEVALLWEVAVVRLMYMTNYQEREAVIDIDPID